MRVSFPHPFPPQVDVVTSRGGTVRRHRHRLCSSTTECSTTLPSSPWSSKTEAEANEAEHKPRSSAGLDFAAPRTTPPPGKSSWVVRTRIRGASPPKFTFAYRTRFELVLSSARSKILSGRDFAGGTFSRACPSRSIGEVVVRSGSTKGKPERTIKTESRHSRDQSTLRTVRACGW